MKKDKVNNSSLDDKSSSNSQEDNINQTNNQENFKTPTTVRYWDYYHNDNAAGRQTQKASYLITNAKKPTINASRSQEKNKTQNDIARKKQKIKNSLFDKNNLEDFNDYNQDELNNLQDPLLGCKNMTKDFEKINLKQQDEFFSSQSEKYKKHQKEYDTIFDKFFKKEKKKRKPSIPETPKKLVANEKKKTKKILNKHISKKERKITNLMHNIKQQKIKKKQNLKKKKDFSVPVGKNQYNHTKQILNRVENSGRYQQFCKNNYR